MIRVNYQDWSSNRTEPVAWRSATLEVAKSVEEGPDTIDLYLSRETKSKNTFTMILDVPEAKALRDVLSALLEE